MHYKTAKKYDCSIILDQNQYINTINLMPISPEQSRQCYHPLSKEETTLLRGALRKLNWVAGMTRSEISFHVCEISIKIKTTTISDIISVNKVYITSVNSSLSRTPPPHPQKKRTPQVTSKYHHLNSFLYYDASVNKLPDGSNQGGCILVFCT